MNVVVDANIIISALLGSQKTIHLIIDKNFKFFAPEIIIDEVEKYKEEISNRAGYSLEEFKENLDALLIFIETINSEDYRNFIEEAKKAIENRDIKDSDYLACALAKNAKLIWTNDKDFSSQDLVNWKTTKELLIICDKLRIFKFKKTDKEILEES